MKANVAKPHAVSLSKPVVFEIPPSLQENLTTAIHGAFEVAVEIAVLEVTKLISAAAGDMFDRIRQENETLKEELQKAQSIIDSVCGETENISLQNGQIRRDKTAPNAAGAAAAHIVYKSDQERKGTLSVDQPLSGEHHQNEEAGQFYPSQEDPVSSAQQRKKWANVTVEDEQTTSHVFNNSSRTGSYTESAHDVKAERTSQPCMGEVEDSPPAVSFLSDGAPQLVRVKEERPEETLIASDSLVNFKEDEIFQLQSDIFQEWTPGVSHFKSEEQNATLQAHSQVHGHPSNMTFSLDSALDSSSSLGVTFPVPSTDHASAPAAGASQDPPPLRPYGSPARCNQGNATKPSPHSCKLCGLGFPLPSLLRRHLGQCPQRLGQRAHVPAAGGKRIKLQLYPPGCSPFRCPECDREFNRLENLKTHLRIHTGERPYKCAVCATAFRHSGALTRHFRIHTGEKPYVCGLCGKCFRNCGGLKFHQRSHNKQLQN